MAASDKEQVENFYELGLDPLHWAFVKLFIRDVLELSENKALPGTYTLYHHVIQNICIMGYVVGKSEKEKMFNFVVDDGTGVITCCQWKELLEEEDEEYVLSISLGVLVTVHGRIKEFRDERQLTVENLRIESDPNAEALHWLDVSNLDEHYKSKGG